MREIKIGIWISIIVTMLAIFTTIFLPEESILKNIFSVVLDGGVAAILILVITYYTEERKSIYNFYIAADTYVEILRSFSCDLAKVHVHFTETESKEEKKLLMEYVMRQLEVTYDKLYEEALIIREETRIFEADSSKSKVQYLMRELYDTIKVDLNCMKNCKRINFYRELYVDEEYELLKRVYDKIILTFIGNKEKEENIFICVRCKSIDEILKKFVYEKWIVLRGGGEKRRDDEYEIVCNEKTIENLFRGFDEVFIGNSY